MAPQVQAGLSITLKLHPFPAPQPTPTGSLEVRHPDQQVLGECAESRLQSPRLCNLMVVASQLLENPCFNVAPSKGTGYSGA